MKEIVLKAFIDYINKGKEGDALDLMEVTAKTVGIDESDFNDAIYELCKDGTFRNIDFDPSDNKRPVMWDRMQIETDSFSWY